MPALKNHRHEAFAQALVRATKTKMTNGQCYSASGYQATGEAAEACAARLLGDARQGVAKRVQEIMEASATRVEVTTATLLADLSRIMAGAESAAQYSAAKAAIDSMARLKGLFVDKVEIGRPGDFDHLQTADQVLALVKDELGDEVAALLQAALARRDAGEHAKVIDHVPAKGNGHDETARAIAQMRPKRRR